MLSSLTVVSGARQASRPPSAVAGRLGSRQLTAVRYLASPHPPTANLPSHGPPAPSSSSLTRLSTSISSHFRSLGGGAAPWAKPADLSRPPKTQGSTPPQCSARGKRHLQEGQTFGIISITRWGVGRHPTNHHHGDCMRTHQCALLAHLLAFSTEETTAPSASAAFAVKLSGGARPNWLGELRLLGEHHWRSWSNTRGWRNWLSDHTCSLYIA